MCELFQTLIRIILCDCVCKGHTAIPRFHFNQLFYVSDLFQTLERIILCDCVCKGHTAISQISFQSLTSGSSFRLLINIILCDCVCKGHKAISQISLKSVTSVSYLSIGQLIMFDNTRFEFNLDSFFLPSKLFSFSILLLLVV